MVGGKVVSLRKDHGVKWYYRSSDVLWHGKWCGCCLMGERSHGRWLRMQDWIRAGVPFLVGVEEK